MKKYQPSNGTEGAEFVEKHCMRCIHCDPDPDGEKQCLIWMRTLMHNVNDPEYPKEWIVNEQGVPTCTAHQPWDWGKDDDPDNPRNPPPKPPPPVPDNQLMLFSDFDELIRLQELETQNR